MALSSATGTAVSGAEAPVGLGAGSLNFASSDIVGGSIVSAARVGGKPWWVVEKLKLLAAKKLFPEAYEARRLRETWEVRELHQNIAALRSVSLAAKIQMQRNRQRQNWEQEQIDRFDGRQTESVIEGIEV